MGRDFPVLETAGKKRERNAAGALLSTPWSAHPPEPKCHHLESLSSDWVKDIVNPQFL